MKSYEELKKIKHSSEKSRQVKKGWEKLGRAKKS